MCYYTYTIIYVYMYKFIVSHTEEREKMENRAKEVNARIFDLLAKRHEEIGRIETTLDELRAKAESAAAEVESATEATDLDAYEAAKKDLGAIESAIVMYSARLNQLKASEYVSETESDAVIGSLLDYEKELEDGYKEAIIEHIEALTNITSQYRADVKEAENAITDWTHKIHANYYSYTNQARRPYPVPVRTLNYSGCKESVQVYDFLKRLK